MTRSHLRTAMLAAALSLPASLDARSAPAGRNGLDVDATHNVAGYAAVGGEMTKGRVRVRAEVREYLSGFRPLTGGSGAMARNDVVALVGVRLTRKGS